MDEITNPYASPTSAPALPAEGVPVDPSSIAGQGARLANLIIDSIGQLIFGFLFGILVALVGGEAGIAWLESIPDLLLGVFLTLLYYIVFEAITSRTLGKLITGTRVVNAVGLPPSFGQIIGRTLCRFIPFEMFSFLGTPTRGWHDRFSETYVVKAR
ncbi:hypothetical protein LBMAG47_29760 [Planctomycetia bacterium]|nr:hypothetical protein LBMAG47_29760 [Planctomycetia bacterium]